MTAGGPLEVSVDVRSAAGADTAVVTPRGEIDLATADELAAALRLPECSGADSVVLDLTQVAFMDSSGLRVLLMLAEERGEQLATVLAEESAVTRLLELVEVIDRLQPAGSVEEALAAVGGNHAE